MKVTDDPKRAPMGTAFLEVCPICKLDTGTLLIKKTGGSPSKTEYTGPMRVQGKNPCEWCRFLNAYLAQEGKEEGTRYGAGKVVIDGALFAFIPFKETDKRECTLADGTPYTMKHRIIIRGERVPETTQIKLVEILDPGVD